MMGFTKVNQSDASDNNHDVLTGFAQISCDMNANIIDNTFLFPLN